MFIITCKSKSLDYSKIALLKRMVHVLLVGLPPSKHRSVIFTVSMALLQNMSVQHVYHYVQIKILYSSTCLSLCANQYLLDYSKIALLKRMVHVLLVGLPPSKHRSFIFTVSMALLQNMSVQHVYHYVQIEIFRLQ